MIDLISFISALISSVIFACGAYGVPAHSSLFGHGLYVRLSLCKNKIIIVPIFAHVAMNTLVVLVQSVYKDDIERILREAEAVQNFIGGFL